MPNLWIAIIAELSEYDALEVLVTHLQRLQKVGAILKALGTRCVRDKHVDYLVRLQKGLAMQSDSAPDIVPNETQFVAHVWNMSC